VIAFDKQHTNRIRIALASPASWRTRGVQTEGNIGGGRSKVSLGRPSIFREAREGEARPSLYENSGLKTACGTRENYGKVIA